MGRMLGAFDNPQELDRPDLNKCPDCECFFAQDACPLCGKICPEEMRAGNRKPPKKEKRRRGGSSGRVTFIEWYHSWWFIILMMFFMPIIGIILLATSPHKRSSKIIFIVIAIVYLLISSIGLGNIIGRIIGIWDKPVDTSLSKEEYVTKCQDTEVEDFYRHAKKYENSFVSLELCVIEKFVDSDGHYNGEDYTTYYVCEGIDGRFRVLVRDCVQDGSVGFVKGDLIRIYGEGAGEITVYDMDYSPRSGPCINVAYVVLKEAEAER